ncbi:unnamed protein product [Phytophthora lilii]|uniref:Unnamed protein product n=1 Tax=Phytophthora lilii TaxID=2077276 RepID=A0A9W6TI38_9STRA|nr:unnamed protein product [Phytophthora lilii]
MASSWNDGEPPALPLPLSIALRGLMADAEALHDRVDFATFVDVAESPRLPHFRDGQSQWKRLEKSSTFTLLKRDDEVLALVRLDAKVEEVASILAASTDSLHTAAMKGLYGDAFIAGSVAFVEHPQGDRVYQHLAVKTSSFMHSDMLGKNEQWCFAETFRCKPDGDSFTLTQGSLSATQAHSLPARSALNDNTRRVAQLRDITTAYFVERLPGSHGIRVVFHAIYNLDKKAEEKNEAEGEAPAVVQKAVRARLLRLARGVSQLSQVIRRRRFGAQVYADHSAFNVRNSRCTCCTRKLTFVMFVPLLPGPEHVLPDPLPTPSQLVLAGRPSSSSTFSTVSTDSTSSSQILAELLSHVVDDDPDELTSGRRHAALMVLNQLLTADQEEAQVQADANKLLLNNAIAPSKPEPIIYPIPSNENVRLAAIDHFCLHDIVNVPELNVVCTLAAAEMGCPHSVITIVERESVTLLATNAPENWDVGSGNPREQTFCQHFVMDDQPLLVRHAEADMRFYHIAPVTMRSLRFYAGFPVSVSSVLKSENPSEPDRVVVGALCCLDEKPHQMTRSQYWRLMKLAEAASTILERSAKEFIAEPRNHPRRQNGIGVQNAARKSATAAVAC